MAIQSALRQSHADILAGIEPAIRSCQEHSAFGDPQAIIELIERFYSAVCQVRTLELELTRRAALYHLQVHLPTERRTIQYEYAHLGVEGCWFILHAGRGDANEEWDGAAREILSGNFGGGQLQGIRDAADLLMEFAEYTGGQLPNAPCPSADPVARDRFKWLCREIVARLDEADAKNDLRRVGDIEHFVSQLQHAAAAVGINCCPMRFDVELAKDGQRVKGIWLSDPDGQRGSNLAVSSTPLDADGNAAAVETIWGGERRAREIRATIREYLSRWIRWADQPTIPSPAQVAADVPTDDGPSDAVAAVESTKAAVSKTTGRGRKPIDPVLDAMIEAHQANEPNIDAWGLAAKADVKEFLKDSKNPIGRIQQSQQRLRGKRAYDRKRVNSAK